MKQKETESRRNFLKTSATAAVGLAIMGPGLKKAAAADIPTKVVNLSTTPINQDIDNLRVAWITDSAMMRNNKWGGFDTFNNPAATTSGAVYPVIKDNVDKLACALANKTKVSDAWATIFKIPPTKTWATAKAAIKVNCFAGDFPTVAIVARICEVLIGKGMPAANVCLMDGNSSGIYSKYTGAGKQIPAGVTFSNAKDNTLVFPDGTKSTVATALASADIAVSIAVNKGHDRFDEFSGVTMCQKNHFWTMDCGHIGAAGAFAKLARNNSCDHLIGNIPTSYPAKQQLCIVDSLWLGNPGDWAGGINDGNNANSIVMCTFAGAADYVATMKIRATKMSGWNQPIVDRFITEYGYTAAAKTTVMTAQTGAGAGLVDAKGIAVETLPHENLNLSREGIVQFSVLGSGLQPMHTNLFLTKGETVQSALILDLQGKKIRTLNAPVGSMHVIWDGRTDGGSLAHAGSYVVKIKGERSRSSGEVFVRR